MDATFGDLRTAMRDRKQGKIFVSLKRRFEYERYKKPIVGLFKDVNTLCCFDSIPLSIFDGIPVSRVMKLPSIGIRSAETLNDALASFGVSLDMSEFYTEVGILKRIARCIDKRMDAEDEIKRLEIMLAKLGSNPSQRLEALVEEPKSCPQKKQRVSSPLLCHRPH